MAVHEGANGWSISSGGMWLPGIYDSAATARYAFQFPNEVLQELNDRIVRVTGENRMITKRDLQEKA